MNIANPEDSLEAWESDRRAVLSDTDLSDEERLRMLHETDANHALVHDTVTAYFDMRFMRIA